MRVRIAVIYDDEVIEDSLSISTDGPEVTGRRYEEIGKDVVRQLQRAAHTLALRVPCADCGAEATLPCKPDYGCSDESRFKLSLHPHST